MSRLHKMVGVGLLFLLLLGPTYAAPDACEDPGQWFSEVLPPEVVALVCSIIDNSEPVTLEWNPETDPDGWELQDQVQTTIQQSDLPEELKQELLIWLLLWTQP